MQPRRTQRAAHPARPHLRPGGLLLPASAHPDPPQGLHHARFLLVFVLAHIDDPRLVAGVVPATVLAVAVPAGGAQLPRTAAWAPAPAGKSVVEGQRETER